MPVLFVLFFPEGDERLIAFFFAVLVAMSKCIHDATHSGGWMTFILGEKRNRRRLSIVARIGPSLGNRPPSHLRYGERSGKCPQTQDRIANPYSLRIPFYPKSDLRFPH